MAEASAGSTEASTQQTAEEEVADYTGLHVDDDPTQVVDETTPEQTVAGSEAGDTVTGGDAGDQPNAPQPGTPNKALQKLQQDQSAAERTLALLLDRLDQNGSLTPKERQQATDAKRKLDLVKEALATRSFDLFDHGNDLAEAVLEQAEDNKSLRQQMAEQAQQFDDLREQMSWQLLGQKYPGVDLQAIWDKALKDAEPYARYGEEALQHRADELFHGVAKAAAASVKAKKQQANGGSAPKLPSLGNKPPVTHGGARVTVKPNAPAASAPASEEQRHMADYMKLWQPDDK